MDDEGRAWPIRQGDHSRGTASPHTGSHNPGRGPGRRGSSTPRPARTARSSDRHLPPLLLLVRGPGVDELDFAGPDAGRVRADVGGTRGPEPGQLPADLGQAGDLGVDLGTAAANERFGVPTGAAAAVA